MVVTGRRRSGRLANIDPAQFGCAIRIKLISALILQEGQKNSFCRKTAGLVNEYLYVGSTFCMESLLKIVSSWSNERLPLSYPLSSSKLGKMGKMAIWLTGPRWDHVSQPDGGNHFSAWQSFCSLARKHLPLLPFLACFRLPLRPSHRFYSALQNATETGGRVYRTAI